MLKKHGRENWQLAQTKTIRKAICKDRLKAILTCNKMPLKHIQVLSTQEDIALLTPEFLHGQIKILKLTGKFLKANLHIAKHFATKFLNGLIYNF